MQFHPFTTPPPAFTIGLHPLPQDHPFHRDNEVDRYRAEKITLFRDLPGSVVQAETDTMEAQQEANDLLRPFIQDYKNRVELEAEFASLGPLALTALGLQEDLLLLRRDKQSWRLVAAALCFPSSWKLSEKFGKHLEEIHAPVPHMEGQMGDRIRRIFDMLRPETPLWRENWSIDGDDELRHERGIDTRLPDYKADKLSGTIYLRCEYQTLHKLPVSGDILFTVKILVRSVPELAKTETGRQYLTNLQTALPGISSEGIAYKGLTGNEERLLAILNETL